MSHHERDNTTLDPRLIAAFNAMNEQPAEHPDWPGFQQQVINSMQHSKPSLAARLTKTLTNWLSLPLPRLGLAASAILAMVAGLLFLTGQPGISYASVVTQLRELSSMVLTSNVQLDHDSRTTTIIHYQRPDLIRTETTTWMRGEPISSTLVITDLAQQQSVVLIEGSNMAMVIELPEQNLDNPKFNPLFWLDELQQRPEESAVNLGARRIDGFKAVGYQVQTERLDIVIWADQQTSIPVRFEIMPLPGSALPPDFNIFGDAQINVELDPALFIQDIPSNYQLMPIDVSN